MKTKKAPLLPTLRRTLSQMGENIQLARQRRQLTASLVAQRAGISRQTLIGVEKGDDGVSIGAYASVLLALGLEKEILKIGADDILGRKLQDAQLLKAKR